MNRTNTFLPVTALLVAMLVACGGAPPSEDPAVAGKGDWAYGWNGENDDCSYNWTCSTGLFCQPRAFSVSFDKEAEQSLFTAGKVRIMPKDYRCGPKAAQGEYCDDNADCAVGLACRLTERPINQYATVEGGLLGGQTIFVESNQVPNCQP